jgi:hypothetical protein
LVSFNTEYFVFYYAIKLIKYKIYKICLPVVLYVSKTWFLTLRKERILKVFEVRALRRIFGPLTDDVRGDWRKLQNEELIDLFSFTQILFG